MPIRIKPINDNAYYSKTQNEYENNIDSKASIYEKYLNNDGIGKPLIFGKLAKELNYTNYNSKDYEQIYSGRDLKKNQLVEIKNRTGYDVVMTHHKSISILYLKDDKTKKAIDEASAVALEEVSKEIEKMLKSANRKKELRQNVIESKGIFTAFKHIENREREPHLHWHLTIPNMVELTFSDGTKKTVAVDMDEVYKNKFYLDAIYQTILANELKKRNISVDIVLDKDKQPSNSIRVNISDEFCDKLSSRANALNKNLEKFIDEQKSKGIFYSNQDQAIADLESSIEFKRAITAKEKKPGGFGELINEMRDKVENLRILGFSQVRVANDYRELHRDINKYVEEAINTNLALNGVMSKQELKNILLNHYKLDIKDSTIEEIDKYLNAKIEEYKSIAGLVELEKGLITTKKHIQNQIAVVDIFNRLSKPSNDLNIIDNLSKKKWATEEHRQSALKIAKSQISLLEGKAGSGKTTLLMKELVKEHKASGYKVIGLAPGTKQALALKSIGVDKTNSLEGFKRNSDLDPNQKYFIMVDEAAMAETEHWKYVLEIAEKHKNIKLLFVGDRAQFKSVGYGTSFDDVYSQMNKDYYSSLKVSLRQKTDEQKLITKLMLDRKIEEALDILEKGNNLVLGETIDDLKKSAINRYFSIETESKAIITFYNKDTRAINSSIRQELHNKKILNLNNQKEIVVVNKKGEEEKLNFVENDKVVITANMKIKLDKQSITIPNNTEALITKIEEKMIKGKPTRFITIKYTDIETNSEKEITLNTNIHNRFNHFYAQTSYYSQGCTVEKSLIYNPLGITNANQNYVEFSRQEYDVSLFVLKENLEKYKQTAKEEQTKFSIFQSEKLAEIKNSLIENQSQEQKQEVQKPVETSPKPVSIPVPNQSNTVSMKKEEVITLLKSGKDIFKDLPDSLKDNMEIGELAIKLNDENYNNLSDRLKNDIDFLEKIVRDKPNIYVKLPPELKRIHQICLSLVKNREDIYYNSLPDDMKQMKTKWNVVEYLTRSVEKLSKMKALYSKNKQANIKAKKLKE